MEDVPTCRSRQDLLRAAITLAPDLARYLRRTGVDLSDAQDLMQEVYLRILRIQRLHGVEHPRAYLYKVASSVAHEHWLRRAACPQQVPLDATAIEEAAFTANTDESSAPESAALITERLDALTTRLNELAPRVRSAILWHHLEGFTCDEIAEKLSAATHRVKKYLAKGLAHCREAARAIELTEPS
jgi:RNA polymerase sigma-70 factor (ECF subfamily)